MNPDKCPGCHQLCDPFDQEYCIWQGHRWHVSCALKQVSDDIETMREKQGRYDTTAANYSALQVKIDNLLDDREGLLRIARGVPEQAQQLGQLFMKSGENLVRRDPTGQLLEGETDSRNLFGLHDAEYEQLEERKKNLIEGGNDEIETGDETRD